MTRTRAVVVTGSTAAIREVEVGDPGPGEALVDVTYSSLNYKDGMALGGDPGVKRVDPLVPGIDVVGTVIALGPAATDEHDDGSRASDGTATRPIAVGDRVVLNGAGAGETRDGGYTGHAVVPVAPLVRLPDGMSDSTAAAIGTAGFTAALSVIALERFVDPGDDPVLVTGSSGGVGSVAIPLLAARGYRVVASTGRPENTVSLLRLGASSVIDRAELQDPGKPVQRPRWAGAVDSVGGATLANVLAQTRWGGAVTACGLAQDARLDTTVLPFILRAVSLLGINSVDAPPALRAAAWDRLATDLDLDLLADVTTVVGLEEAIRLGPEVLAGRVHGRTVIDVRQ